MPFASGVFLEAPDFATAPISGVVGAFHGGVVFAPIDAEADHADSLIDVTVFGDREETDAGVGGFVFDGEGVATAHELPSVVFAAFAFGGLEIDFLPVILADIGDEEVTRFAIEGESPWVADAVGPDFGFGVGMNFGELFFGDPEESHLLERGDERIILRDRVSAIRGGVFDINPEHFAHESGEILASAEDIAFPAAVADADIEEAIWAEGHFSAVMIAVGEIELHDHLPAFHVGFIGIFGGDLILHDQGGAIEPEVGISDIEEAVFFELGVKFDAEKTEFEEGTDRLIFEIEERFFEEFTVFDDADDAWAFADEEAIGAVFWGGDVNGVDETSGDLDELDGLFFGEFATGLGGNDGFGVGELGGQA